MKKTVLILATILITEYWAQNSTKGADLGIHGHTFEIQEPDLLKELESKLQLLEENGELKKHQEILRNKAEQSVRTPPPVEGITKTIKQRVFYYDPSITVPYDLKDHQGRVFHKKGTQINPLKFRSLSSSLIFIDGVDEDQVNWVKETYLKQNHKAKVILTSGAPFELMEILNETIYFDQGGTITKKLGIKHVPAVVVQEGLKLKITELALEEKKK